MDKKSIILLGLGPGDADFLTRQAWQTLESLTEIYLRTQHHPAVVGFPAGLKVYTFDHLYENGESYETVYAQIVERILGLGRRPQGVVYAVPGHPLVAEATSRQIVERSQKEGISCQIIEGLSFLEPTFTAMGLDPLPHTTLIDALELVNAHFPPFPPDAPVLIAQIYSPQIAADVKLTLMALYPDEHDVKLVHAAGTSQSVVEELPLYMIDRSRKIGMLTTLFVPPLGTHTSFEAFQEIIAHLRSPEGCPWDREQTHQTLRRNLLEETYELLAVIDANDPQGMREEFGDLLLQIVLHAQIASEYGEFTMSDILNGIHTKIVRRHPHVFGDLELQKAQQVVENWERLKESEREEMGESGKGTLEGVALALPALAQALEYQVRAARVGFDWPDVQGVLAKITEEVEEVKTAPDVESRSAEIGDLLFTVVNLARWYDVDAESALREANLRFRDRFSNVEQAAKERGLLLSELTLDEMNQLWQQVRK